MHIASRIGVRKHLDARPASGQRAVAQQPLVAGGGAAEGTLEGRAVRLGLRTIRGFAESAARRVIAARPFASVETLAQRAALNRRELAALAGSGALAALAGHRRAARWATAGVARDQGGLAGVLLPETPAILAQPSEGEEIVSDYASLGLTLGRHPLALLRARLRQRRILSAEALRITPHGRRAQTAGLVTCRQRPGTASGVMFLTLEDETGSTNVVVWRDLAERQRRELLGARLLGVQGVIERDGEVVHLVARRLLDYSRLLSTVLGPLETHSRDFR